MRITCGARPTPGHSHSRASSVGKTPSFSFCQVDMYAIVKTKTGDVTDKNNYRPILNMTSATMLRKRNAWLYPQPNLNWKTLLVFFKLY